MSNRIVMGIHVTNRVERIPDVQALLTEYGCNIKTRLGLHQASEATCSSKGLLILEMCGDESRACELETKMAAIPGVAVQKMVFEE